MKDLLGKVAFITGGASGLGFSMAQVFGEIGMKVAIADVRQDRLDEAAAQLRLDGVSVCAVNLDVTDRAAYARAADKVEQTLGPVQLLCNNAGIGVMGQLKNATYEDWDWILGVNLGGVINGVQTFLPRMRARKHGGHIMSTASAAGLIASDNVGIYTTSKMAVVGMMEVLRAELADEDIGVSVLCPHLMRTRIYELALSRLRKDESANPSASATAAIDDIKAANDAGMDPLKVARCALQAVLDNRLYVIPFPELREIITDRFSAILAALPDETPDPARVAAEAPTLVFKPYREALGLL